MQLNGYQYPTMGAMTTKKLQLAALQIIRDASCKAYQELLHHKQLIKREVQNVYGKTPSQSSGGRPQARGFVAPTSQPYEPPDSRSSANSFVYNNRSQAEQTLSHYKPSVPSADSQSATRNGVEYPTHSRTARIIGSLIVLDVTTQAVKNGSIKMSVPIALSMFRITSVMVTQPCIKRVVLLLMSKVLMYPRMHGLTVSV
eukprot:scaffold16878_cov49-Attheya_sp.AAC.1